MYLKFFTIFGDDTLPLQMNASVYCKAPRWEYVNGFENVELDTSNCKTRL